MQINLRRSIGSKYLMCKMFARMVRPRLYGKVIRNTLNQIRKIEKPSSAVLALTHRCQAECVHCSASVGSYKNERRVEFSTDQWKQILDAVDKLEVPRINFTGGEALLRKDIFELIAYASKKFVVILESNGIRLNRDVVAKLKKAHVSCVAVSLDSVDEDEHDSLRRVEGCFKKALEGIKNLTDAGIPCIMSTYIPREKAKAEYLQAFMILVRKMNAMALRILPPRPVGNYRNCNGSNLKPEDEKIIRQYSDPTISYFNGMPAPQMCGIINKATFYISPYGDIQTCPYMPISFANTDKGRLAQKLESMWTHPIFQGQGTECFVLKDSFQKEHLSDVSALNPLKYMHEPAAK